MDLHYPTFLNTEMVQVVKILFHGRQQPVCPAQLMPWYLMTWGPFY